MIETKVDKLKVKILDSRIDLGKEAARDIHSAIIGLLSHKEYINIIFAAAPSQNETLDSLLTYDDIDFTRINAFHMDEYIGLDENAEERFSKYLSDRIFSKKPFRKVNYINASAKNKEAECERYSRLLRENPVDIVILGIGENGHIAFNDPPVADFCDKALIKPVKLDDICRNQQVNDGCFPSIDKVPEYALSLTIPALVSAKYMFCSVPAKTKAWAVRETLTTDRIDEHCPATALRIHGNATIYLDPDSSADIRIENGIIK